MLLMYCKYFKIVTVKKGNAFVKEIKGSIEKMESI